VSLIAPRNYACRLLNPAPRAPPLLLPFPIRSSTGVINDGTLLSLSLPPFLSLSLSLSLSCSLCPRGGENGTATVFRSPERLTKVSTIAHFLIFANPRSSAARRRAVIARSPPANGGFVAEYSRFISNERCSSATSMVGKLNRSTERCGFLSRACFSFNARIGDMNALRALFIALSRGRSSNGIVLRLRSRSCLSVTSNLARCDRDEKISDLHRVVKFHTVACCEDQLAH